MKKTTKKGTIAPNPLPKIENNNDGNDKIIKEKNFTLIAFDLKTKIYLGVCITLFLISIIFKIHGSSIPIWNQIANDGTSMKRGLLYGKPQSIRSDEWLCQTTYILSQDKKGFQTQNYSFGPFNSSLVMNAPVNHFISIFKLNLISFFFLNEEMAYSFYWNYKTFGILVGVFLSMMLLTGNSFTVSLFTSFWILFSSGTQWWFSTNIPEMISSICILFTSFIYFLNAQKLVQQIISMLIFTYFGIFFGLTLYPPYLIPMAYLFVFMLAGYLTINFNKKIYFGGLYSKIPLLLFSLTISCLVFYFFLQDIKPILDLVGNTVYPGKRNELGGTGFTAHALSEYLSLFFNGEKFPKQWANICELSHYITFFPIILCSIIFSLITKRRVSNLIIILSLFQLIGFAWMYFKFPEILAKLSFLYMVPPYRLMIPLGIANIFLTGIFLSDRNNLNFKKEQIVKIVVFIGSFLFIYGTLTSLNSSVDNFFKQNQILISTFLMAGGYFILFFKNDFKLYPYIFMGIVSVYLIKNLTINPISKGLAPIRDNEISKVVTEINAKDPGKWVVFGQFTFSNFLNSSGLDVLSGVKFVPMNKEMRILDPSQKSDSVYNRYAHISFYPFIDGKDSVNFTLIQADSYAIQMDPCGDKFRKLGIKYIFFTYQPQPAEVRCMKLLVSSGINIYKLD